MSTPAPPKAPPPPQKNSDHFASVLFAPFPTVRVCVKNARIVKYTLSIIRNKNRHEIEKLYNFFISDLINDLAKCRAATIVKRHFATYTGKSEYLKKNDKLEILVILNQTQKNLRPNMHPY